MSFPVVIYNDRFLNAISWFMQVGGISLFPFIILRERYRDGGQWWVQRGKETINHESIHFYQARELLVIPFYILYVLEYTVKSIIYLSIDKGYKNISFEREAYGHEADLGYLNTRPCCSWVKRIIK